MRSRAACLLLAYASVGTGLQFAEAGTLPIRLTSADTQMVYTDGDESGPLPSLIRGISETGLALGMHNQKLQIEEAPAPVYDGTDRAVRFGNGTEVTLQPPSAPPTGLLQSTLPNMMNAGGDVVGVSQQYSPDHPFQAASQATYWPRSGGAIALGVPSLDAAGNSYAVANDLNDHGIAVGSYTLFDFTGKSLGDRAVRWDTAYPDQAVTLGTSLPGGTITSSVAVAITNSNIIVGTAHEVASDGTDLGNRIVMWDPVTNQPTELTNPIPTRLGLPRIETNRSNVAIGNVDLTSVRWDLTSGAVMPVSGIVTDVNEAGTVISLKQPNISVNGVTYTRVISVAINNLGVVVGSGRRPSQDALMWLPGGSLVDLNTLIDPGLGVQLVDVQDLSDTGFIVGNARLVAAKINCAFTMLIPQAGTYGLGDANFDTKVDFADLLVLAKHYGQQTGGSYDAGDFDLNGVTDFSDLLTLAKHYGTSPAAVLAATDNAAFANDWALAQSLVPEPATATVALLLAAGGGRRRRRVR